MGNGLEGVIDNTATLNVLSDDEARNQVEKLIAKAMMEKNNQSSPAPAVKSVDTKLSPEMSYISSDHRSTRSFNLARKIILSAIILGTAYGIFFCANNFDFDKTNYTIKSKAIQYYNKIITLPKYFEK